MGRQRRGAGEISKPRSSSAVEEGVAGEHPRRRAPTPRGCVGDPALEPQSASRSRLGQPGLAGGRQPEVCAPIPVLGKRGTAGLSKAESRGLGWAPCWVDQHGRLWGRGNGVCWARAPPLPAGGAPTSLCWLGTQDLGPANRAGGRRGWGPAQAPPGEIEASPECLRGRGGAALQALHHILTIRPVCQGDC